MRKGDIFAGFLTAVVIALIFLSFNVFSQIENKPINSPNEESNSKYSTELSILKIGFSFFSGTLLSFGLTLSFGGSSDPRKRSVQIIYKDLNRPLQKKFIEGERLERSRSRNFLLGFAMLIICIVTFLFAYQGNILTHVFDNFWRKGLYMASVITFILSLISILAIVLNLRRYNKIFNEIYEYSVTNPKEEIQAI